MFLTANGSKLFYSRYGQGKKTLILFHGFGQDHSVFKTIIETLSEKYTCYAFDLYFHGASLWANNEEALEKKEWKEIFTSFLKENEINDFSLLGYSLGGKFVLATLEAFPEKVKEIFLIAPDGIKPSFWYSLATYPIIMRKVFKSMIRNHNRFLKVANFIHSLGLLENGVLRFAESQMNTDEKRRRVYYSWVVFRHLSFNMKKLAVIINKHQVRVLIITGKYDKVIRTESMNGLIQRLDHYALEIMEVGHNHLLGRETAKLISSKAI